jgi:hypothetical protein
MVSKTYMILSIPIDPNSNLEERITNYCWHNRITLSSFIEEALMNHILAAEKTFNNGEPFPKRNR